MKKLIMTIGISGAGQLDYAKREFAPEVIVSPDMIREELNLDPKDKTVDAVVWMTATKRIHECLAKYDECILVSNNTNSAHRKGFMAPFKKSQDTTFYAIVFPKEPSKVKTPERTQLDNNKVKTESKVVPQKMIDAQYKEFNNGYKAIWRQFDHVLIIEENDTSLSKLLKELKIAR